MASYDVVHTFAFYVKAPSSGSFTNLWPYVLKGATIVDVEGAETDTLTIELENYDGTIATITEWSECYLRVDGTTDLFYGKVTKVKPKLSKSGAWAIYTLTCESFITLLKKLPTVTGTWTNITAKALVAAIFTAAGATGWDVTTYVSTGPTISSFTAKDEQVAAILNRLSLIVSKLAATTWIWRVENGAVLRFEASSTTVAPFSITTIDLANWTTSFPPAKEIDADLDASEITNRVTIKGGTQISGIITDTFNGDGSTVLFNLSRMNISVIESITVNGAIQRYAVDWYDTFGGGSNCLVNYVAGTVRWPIAVPPPVGVGNVVVKYRNAVRVSLTVSDEASHTKYGMWFDREVSDTSITTDVQATAVADAILREYGSGVISGTFSVERYGLRAGQLVTIYFPLLGLNAAFPVRRVSTAIDKAASGVKSVVQFGGRSQTISGAISGVTGGNGGGGFVIDDGPVDPTINGEVDVVRVTGRIELIDPLTYYVEP